MADYHNLGDEMFRIERAGEETRAYLVTIAEIHDGYVVDSDGKRHDDGSLALVPASADLVYQLKQSGGPYFVFDDDDDDEPITREEIERAEAAGEVITEEQMTEMIRRQREG